MAQPAPKDKDFVAVGKESWTPPALYDRDPLEWLGEKHTCRQILKELVERELASLRQREEQLRTNYEDPARDGAEIRRQVLTSPEGSLLLRHDRAHGLVYDRSYNAFLKGRLQSLKTGRPPGAPDPVDDEEADRNPDSVAVAAAAAAVAESRARRKRAAAAVAPGADNGIGAGGPGRRLCGRGHGGAAAEARRLSEGCRVVTLLLLPKFRLSHHFNGFRVPRSGMPVL